MLTIKSKQRGGPAATAKALQEAARNAAVDVVRHWHEQMMPGHFTVEGGKKYGYQPRRGDNEPPYLERKTRWSVAARHQRTIRLPNPAYSWRKRRVKRHNKPLVWSGQSEAAAKSVVRLSSRIKRVDTKEVVGTAAMPALPRYFYMYRTTESRLQYRGWGSGSFQTTINGKHTAPNKADELTRTTSGEVQALRGVFAGAMGEKLSDLQRSAALRRGA